jgi:hypothetical protein
LAKCQIQNKPSSEYRYSASPPDWRQSGRSSNCRMMDELWNIKSALYLYLPPGRQAQHQAERQ